MPEVTKNRGGNMKTKTMGKRKSVICHICIYIYAVPDDRISLWNVQTVACPMVMQQCNFAQRYANVPAVSNVVHPPSGCQRVKGCELLWASDPEKPSEHVVHLVI